jgi:GT2 family glycosyltransferase
MFKKEWAERFPYNEAFTGNSLREESDFNFRCHEAGAKMYFCSDAVAWHMFHDYGGGCRSNVLGYTLSGIRNNRRFLKRHWKAFAEAGGIESSRFAYGLRFAWRFFRMSVLFWMAANMPGLHATLKRIFSRQT